MAKHLNSLWFICWQVTRFKPQFREFFYFLESALFVTMPPFEQIMPRELIGPNQKYWRAVTLSLESPWYLFVYEAEFEDQRTPQTMLVGWESTLLDILASIPEENCLAIARMERRGDDAPRWEMTWIQRIWAPTREETNETGLFLLELEGDPQLRDAHLQPVPNRAGRKLLFGTPPSSSSQKEAPANA